MWKHAVPKGSRDNRANQLNPTHPAYHQSRGASPQKAERAAEQARMARSAHSDVARSVPVQPESSGLKTGKVPPAHRDRRRVSDGLIK